MFIYLPYPDYEKSVECFDEETLGWQRIYAFRALVILTAKKPQNFPSYCNHPATLMWKGYKNSLCLYLQTMGRHWRSQWFEDNLTPKAREHCTLSPRELEQGHPHYPFWWGDERVHSSHRSALLQNNSEHYKQFGWTEPDNIPYFWPVRGK